MNHHRRLFQSWLKSRKPVFFICFLKLRKKKKESLIFWILKSLLYLYMIRQATSKFNNPLKLRPGWVTFSGNKKPFTNKVDTQGKFPPLLIPCLKCLKKKKNPKKRVIMIQIIDKELSSIRYLLAFTHAFDFNYSYWYSYVNIAPIELKSYNVIIQFELDLVIFFSDVVIVEEEEDQTSNLKVTV